MSDYLKSVVNTLNEICKVSLVWPRGLMHAGGPHYRVAGMYLPISIGEDECLVFGKIIETFRPEHCFIIGNAFGLSAAYITHMMMEHGSKSVVTLDSQTEGDGKRNAAIANKLTGRLGLSILKNKKGFSPKDISSTVEVPVHQLIFIDGKHTHPQVTLDFEGALPHSDDKTIFVWHDFWIPGIPQCIDVARSKGFRCLWLPTSCEMVLGTRDVETFEKLRKLFPNCRENFPPRSYLPIFWVPIFSYIRFIYETVTQLASREIPKD